MTSWKLWRTGRGEGRDAKHTARRREVQGAGEGEGEGVGVDVGVNVRMNA